MKPSALDATDLHLLDQLQNDASLSNLDLAALVHISPPTCLRRVKRLRDAGLIERQIALLSVDKLQQMAGYGLCAIVEITLDRRIRARWTRLRDAWLQTMRCNNAIASRRARTFVWWCMRPTCQITWRWRS